jgi:four helix bundle protein
LAFGVWRLAFGVWRLAFGVWRLAFGVWPHYRIFTNVNKKRYYISLMKDFTEFDAFQRCQDFTRAVAGHLNYGTFSRDSVLASHLRKTILSIYSNFAEGFERDGNREFAQFVSIAKASVAEARGQLLYAVDFGYLDVEKFREMNGLAERAGQCLGGLMRFLNTTEIRGRKFKLAPDSVHAPNAKRQTPNAKRYAATEIRGRKLKLAPDSVRAPNAKRQTPNAKRS